MGILSAYVKEAMHRAKYEIIEDEEPFYGYIPEIQGVWATAKTLETCRDELESTLEDWLLFSIEFKLHIPDLDNVRITRGSLETRKSA